MGTAQSKVAGRGDFNLPTTKLRYLLRFATIEAMVLSEAVRKAEEEVTRCQSILATAERTPPMPSAWFGPCPHCNSALSYLEGVTGSTMSPSCPRCKVPVAVLRATFLMADYSRPIPYAKQTRKRRDEP